jgi:plastocyanin
MAAVTPGHAAIDQVGCMYRPHVQAVTVGSELTLLNSDRVLHNVHGNLGSVTVFNLAMPIKGQKLPTKLTRPGLVRLQCDAGHSWMTAWIHVFRERTFAVTDERGHFSIADVAPGEYTIEYWHEPLDGKGDGITSTARVVVGAKPVHADARIKL